VSTSRARTLLHGLIAGALLAAALARPAPLFGEDASFELENGLRVQLIAAEGLAASPLSRVAVVVLFDIGEAHDPEERPGLAHLIEHLFVTAAAGEIPARTAEEWSAAHDGRANAQTGRDYTMIAAVAPPDRLEAELAEAAARLGGMRIEGADLERELARLRTELDNMYGGNLPLAARNHAQNAIDPLPGGARRGGDAAALAGIGIEEVAARISGHYVPSRARIVVAGAFDLAGTRARIEALFGAIPRRDPEPLATRSAPAPRTGERLDIAAPAPGSPNAGGSAVARLWAAPPLSGPEGAAFLLLGAKFLQVAPAHGVTPVFAPIDDPRVFGGIVSLAEGEIAADAVSRIDRALAAALKAEGPLPRQWAERSLDHLLSLRPPAASSIATNPYLVAFGSGRRAQLALDRVALVESLSALDEARLRELRESVLATERSVTVTIAARAPAPPGSGGNEVEPASGGKDR
jgi:zinc protease